MSPILLAVAHGSRDPAAKECVLSLTGHVARLAGGTRVEAAFVQHAEPSLATALAGVTAEATADGAAIVPLLLSGGYHLSYDIGAAARAAGVPVAPPLGPDPRLVHALADRLDEAGVPDGVPVVLAAAGSLDAGALADARHQAALLARHRGTSVVAAFASAARPTVDEAVTFLAGLTGKPVAVAAYLLAPGLFHDQLWLSSGTWVSAPLGDHPAVAELIVDRFRAVAGQLTGGREALAGARGC